MAQSIQPLMEETAEAVVTNGQLLEAMQDLADKIDSLGLFALGLAVLVLLLGLFVTRGQRRIARNQIELADLARKSLASKVGE